MRDVGQRESGRQIMRLGSVVALLLVCALVATGLGCTNAPTTTDTAVAPSSTGSSDASTEQLRVMLQARIAQREELEARLETLESKLSAATERYNAAQSSSDASVGRLKAEMQAVEAQLAQVIAKRDATDREIEALAERFNASQRSSETTSKP